MKLFFFSIDDVLLKSENFKMFLYLIVLRSNESFDIVKKEFLQLEY